MYVYKTDVAVLCLRNRVLFDGFARSAALVPHLEMATYGVLCQRERLIVGAIPVCVDAQGQHVILDMYSTEPATHAAVCVEMLRLVLDELGGAKAVAWVPCAKTAPAASVGLYLDCCFQIADTTDSHVMVEYKELP